MTKPPDDGHGRSRRAVLLQGVGVLAAIFAVGAVVSKPFMEQSLKDETEQALSDAGIAAHTDFVFQDGRLLCAQAIPDVEAAKRVVLGVRGVQSLSVDPICAVGLVPVSTTVPSSTTEPITTTTTTTPGTTTTPTTTTTGASTTTTVDPATQAVGVALVDGRLTLAGVVGSEVQHAALVEAATAALDPANVVDQLTVDDASPLDDSDVSSMATIIPTMVVPLARGEVGWDGTRLFASGVYTDEAAAKPFADAAEVAGVTAELSAQVAATPEDAAAVQQDMNAIVAANPLPFAKGQTVLGPEAAADMQRLAGIAKRFSGLAIEVQGHTDSEGDPVRNVTLSEQRAQAVADELARLGVPTATLSVRGFGESQLVRDENGVENQVLSRRVVFGVTST